MAAPLNRAQFNKELEPGLNALFGLEYGKHKEEWREIFNVESSEKAFEEDVLLSSFGAAPVKAEGSAVSYDAASEVWTARYTHMTVALAFAITEEAEEDNLYGSLGKKYVRALARSMQHTKNVFGANVLNRGFNSTYTGGDGVELFSLVHPTVGGGNQQNELTTPADLNETSIESVLILIADLKDDRGKNIAARGQKLIVPTALEYDAARILHSTQRVGTADNDVNAIKDLGKLSGDFCVNHYLTDADAWFIKTDCPDGLKYFERVGMKKGMEGDFETGNLRYKCRERYSFGWTDWRSIFGSAGA